MKKEKAASGDAEAAHVGPNESQSATNLAAITMTWRSSLVAKMRNYSVKNI
jgi:hypothetical protein